jgi:translation initiation factor IF-2
MTESRDSDEVPLKLKTPRKLELKRTVGSGEVRQSFSRGRTKPVTVEVKKKRTTSRGGADEAFAPRPQTEPAAPAAAPSPPPAEPAALMPAEAPAPNETRLTRARVVLKTLTNEEKKARARALDGARQQDENVRRRAAEENQKLREEESRLAREHEQAEKRKEEEEARKREEDTVRKKAEETAARKLVETEPEAEREDVRRSPQAPRRVPTGRRRPSDRRRSSGKLTLTQALNEEERVRSLASVKRARERERRAEGGVPKKVIRDVIIPETISVQELANRMAERAVDVVKVLMRMGVMTPPGAALDADTAELVVGEFGHRYQRVSEADVELGLGAELDSPEALLPRAPVVTVMGHVDHGKTSLLDALRETDVAGGEAGGITQHIGAYQVEMKSGARITFLDTPGHEAFTAMRGRGATITDIVVLVVAADDGIMPQTIEAIRHAKEAGVPIIVAINKIDLPGANPGKVRETLLQHELVVEEMGGETLAIEVSAKSKTNLDKLEEAIVLQSEILELRANPDRDAEGVVVEAKIDTGRGAVATVLVQRGTLRVGDVFVAGGEWGRVRALVSDHGAKLDEAGPAVAVEVLGLSGAPDAGDTFLVVDTDARAREIAAYRQRRGRALRVEGSEKTTMEEMFSRIQEGEAGEFPVLIKTDVHGSLEAIVGAANKLSTDEVKVRVIHGAVGGINESDIGLARASGAVIVGFNVRASAQAREQSRRDKVDIRYYSVIYDVIDEFKGVLTGMLAPTIKEHAIGTSEILEVFNVSKVGKIAGCRVEEGAMRRGSKVRLLRDDVVIHEGKLSNLKRFKDDVEEVKSGMECGMSLEKYQDMQIGDRIEAYETEEIARTL